MGLPGGSAIPSMDRSRKLELSKSLLSNRTCKSILAKNSIQDSQFSKDCKSFEKAKRGLRADFLRTRRQMEKRLERHTEDSLKKDDIRHLQKYIGDKGDEDEFYHKFGTGKMKLSGLESRLQYRGKYSLDNSSFNTAGFRKERGGRNVVTSIGMRGLMKDKSKASTLTRKNLESAGEMESYYEAGKSGGGSYGAQIFEEEECNKSSKGSEIRASKQRGKVGGSNAKNANALEDNPLEKFSSLALQEGELDLNNNVTPQHQNEKHNAAIGHLNFWWKTIPHKIEGNKSSDNIIEDVESEECLVVNETHNEGYKASPRHKRRGSEFRNGGLPVPERLGPTPQEIDEERRERDEHYLTNAQMDQPENLDSNACLQRENSTVTLTPGSKLIRKESFGARSWNGREAGVSGSTNQSHLNLPYKAIKRRISDSGFSWASEPFNLNGGTAVSIAQPRSHRGSVSGLSHCFQKTNSCPSGLGTPRNKPYGEEPFYLAPKRKLSRRISYQQFDQGINADALKRLQELHEKACEDKIMSDTAEEPRPLGEILPPLTLPKIYIQESNEPWKKEQEKETAKSRALANAPGQKPKIDVAKLTKNLRDCRYLRFPNTPLTTKFI